MTFLTILVATQILCSFRLVLEGKTVKVRVFRKFSSKQFYFLRCRIQYIRAVGQRRFSRFTLENIVVNSQKVQKAKFLESDRIFCFTNICKFGSFKNPLATITSLSELYFFSSVGTNEKSDFYELWQLHKQLKTMEMSEA